MKETNILQMIRLGCADIAVLWRNNTGAFQDKTGRWVQYGVGGTGGADLVGFRRGDARFVAIEVKKPGEDPSKEQEDYLLAVMKCGGLAGLAENVEDARKIIIG